MSMTPNAQSMGEIFPKKIFSLLKAPVNRSEIPKDPSQMWVQCCAMLYDVAPPLNPPTEFIQKRPKDFLSLDAQDTQNLLKI